MSDVKFPHVKVQLVGQDGNAYAILARVKKALHDGGACRCSVEDFLKEAMSGDYDNLLRVVMQWVAVDEEGDEE
jgi:hypothetical protein